MRHLALGASGPDAGVANALEDVAVTARSRRGGPAGELLELARSLTPTGERHAASRRSVSAAEHHIHAGDRPRARAILEDILAAELDRPNRSRALRLLGEIEYNQESFATARSALQASLHDADDAASRALVHLDLAYAWAASDIQAAAEHAAAALRQAEQCNDRGLLAECLAVKVMVGFMGGHGVDWTRLKRLGTRRQQPDRAVLSSAAMCRLHDLYSLLPVCGQWSFDQVLATTAERGDESDLAYVHSWMTFLLARAGRLDEARHHLAEAQRQAAFAGGVNRCGCSPTPRSSRRSPATPRCARRRRRGSRTCRRSTMCLTDWLVDGRPRHARSLLRRSGRGVVRCRGQRSSWSSLAVSASRERCSSPRASKRLSRSVSSTAPIAY